jgi:hypothetical protein
MALPIAAAERQRLRTTGEAKFKASPACPPHQLFAIAALPRLPASRPALRSILTVGTRLGTRLRALGGARGSPGWSDWKLAAISLMGYRPSLVAEVGKRQ